ncbi:MAG: glycosyltransferase [Bacteroidetes bacterium]|nr:glycosyltransferase [Bacteroidota bacterium]
MAKRIVVTVISDLVTDQRVHKVCQTLHDAGYEILLIGAKKKKSLPLEKRDYKAIRIPLLFQRKIFFFLEFNTRLFLKLLFTKADIFLGNDLDVMAATFFAGRWKKKQIVYDTHEYYMAMAGLDNKIIRKKIWKTLESYIFPRLQFIYTICDSFCELYRKDYGKELRTVRNVPYLHDKSPNADPQLLKKIDALIPQNKKLLIFQGAGINPHRGVEELVLAMRFLDSKKYHLLLVGGGDIFSLIEEMIHEHKLEEIITVIPKVPFQVLRHITRQAHLGLSLDKPDNLNHRYGLPNKIFDYLHAGLPVLVSRLVELEKIVNFYRVGTFIENHDPNHIAACIESAFENTDSMKLWKENTVIAKKELNWENEGKIVLEIFKQVAAEKVN